MRKRNITLDLRIFDGGSGGGADGGSGGGAEGAGNQASEISGGAAAEKADGGGADTGTAGVHGGETPAAKTPEQLKNEFDTLINGEYRDLYAESIRGLMQKSIEERDSLNGQLDEVKPLISLLSEKYGIRTGKVADILKALDEDDSFYEEAAMKEGVTVEQYKRMVKMEAENRQLREAQKRSEQIRQRDDTWKRWDREAEACKAQFPGFDMQTEARNPDFVRLLGAGFDVSTAYKAIHHDEIVRGMMARSAEETKREVAGKIQSGYGRPLENPTSGNGASTSKIDPSNMTDEQMQDLIERARNGERIEF